MSKVEKKAKDKDRKDFRVKERISITGNMVVSLEKATDDIKWLFQHWPFGQGNDQVFRPGPCPWARSQFQFGQTILSIMYVFGYITFIQTTQ